MNQMQVGVRELRTRLSEYLRQVKAGRTVVITEHGRQVGRIVPATQPVEVSLQGMAQSGLVAWSGSKLTPSPPAARVRGEGTVADLLVEDRG